MKYILKIKSEEELKVGDCNNCSFCYWERNLNYGEWDGTLTAYCPFKKNPIIENHNCWDSEPVINVVCPVCIKKTE